MNEQKYQKLGKYYPNNSDCFMGEVDHELTFLKVQSQHIILWKNINLGLTYSCFWRREKGSTCSWIFNSSNVKGTS